MRKIETFMLLVLTLMPLGLMAEEIATRTFTFKKPIDAIEIRGAGELQIIQGDSEELTVTTTEKMMKRVGARQENNTLFLSTQEHSWNIFKWGEDDDRVTFTLSLKQLKRLQASGAAIVKMHELTGDQFVLESVGAARIRFGKITLDNMNLTLTGATEINVDSLTAKGLSAELVGASRFTLGQAGSVDSLKVSATGASQFDASRLKSQTADVQVVGASNAEVYAVQKLAVIASGASSVDYFGDAVAKVDTSGASSANHKGSSPE